MIKKVNWQKQIKQLWIINLFFLIFYMSAIYSSSWKVVRANWMMLEGILIIGSIVALSYKLGKFKIEKNFEIEKIIKKNWLFCLIFLGSILIRISQLTGGIIWDAGEYYGRLITATEKFDFSLTAFLDNFNLANHPNYGYTFFTGIGEFLFPRKVWGVNLVVLILTAFALVFLYRIFNKYLKLNKTTSSLLCGLFSFSPLVLGTSGYYNPDYGIALFFIFIMYFFLEKKYILFTFWSICFVFTKEVSAIIYFFFIVGILMAKFLEKKDEKVGNSFFIIFKNPVIYISIIVGLFYLGYMKYIGGITKWKQVEGAGSNFTWNNDVFNCFGFNREYVILKFQQMFIENYRWIIIILAFFGCLLILLFKKKLNLSVNKYLLFSIVLSLLSYICFNCLYITFALVRYNYISDLLIIIVLGMIISEISKLKAKNIINGSLIMICVIFCIESFVTTDPISKAIYPFVPTNSISMIYPGYLEKEIYYGDNLVYNNQYSFLSKSYNQFLKNIEYDEKKMVAFPGNFDGSQINGNGEIYQVNWDKKNSRRTFENLSDSVIPIKTENLESILSIKKKKDMPEEVVVPFIPYFYWNLGKNEVKEEMKKNYELILEGKTEGIQGNIEYQYYKKK